MATPEEIQQFWLEEVGPKGWYTASDALDDTIRDRFGALWQLARAGACDHWMSDAAGVLSYLILMDQFSRNMFRGSALAFATDPHALAASKRAVLRDLDLQIPEPQRQFFYLPLMHSESLADQDRCVRLMSLRLRESPENLVHAQVHRAIIRKFGRFPYRNAALGRKNTAAEQAFLDDEGGYGALMRAMQQAEAA